MAGSMSTASTSMAGSKKQQTTPDAFTSFKYGMPIYGLAWPEGDVFFMCGGGGSASTGIKNRVVCARRTHGMLTDQVADYNFGANCPMRLTVSPNGKSVVVAMAQGGIQRLDISMQGQAPKLTPVTGELTSKMTADKLEYKVLAFSIKGDHLVLGSGQDGSLRVIRWPTLEERFSLKGDRKLDNSIRDVSCAPGPRATRFAVVLDNKTAEIWDWDMQTCVCKAGAATRGELRNDRVIAMTGPEASATQELPADMSNAGFVCLRYAPRPPATPASGSNSSSAVPSTPAGTTGGSPAAPLLLYALMNNRNGCWVVAWEQDSSTGMLKMLRYKHVSADPASCFDVSHCGQLLAVGTSQATIIVLKAATLDVVRSRPKAHTVFCTGVVFSPDGQHVLSVSGDASATLTSTQATPTNKMTFSRLLMLIIILFCLFMTLYLQVMKAARQLGKHELAEAMRQKLHLLPIPSLSWLEEKFRSGFS